MTNTEKRALYRRLRAAGMPKSRADLHVLIVEAGQRVGFGDAQ